MWCLIRLLPIMIGDLIPDDCEHWINFLRLLSIVEFVFAPQTTVGIAGYLRNLICDHHSTFTKLYPHRPVTPKFHYITHLPKWIVK